VERRLRGDGGRPRSGSSQPRSARFPSF
jgi:hypothetical protein